jgi:hypothetical protein
MSRALRACVAVAVGAVVLALAAATASAADRVAVVVGNNAGRADEVTLRYAELDAEKVARVLTSLGGFAGGDVHLRLGRSADDVRGLLRALARRPGRAPLQLFFYYSGHGTGTALHLGESQLPLDELRALLAAVDADLRVVVLDSCKSGEVIRTKGMIKGAGFEIDAVLEPEVTGSVFITSSASSEAAQESDRLRGSFFTHHLVTGLYGAADADRDGRVTLEEAYGFAHFHTLESTSGAAGSVQHPSWGLSVKGRGEIVLTRLARSSAKLAVAGGSRPGQYLVLDPERELVLVELVVGGPGGLSARLPPGRYRVRKREGQSLFGGAVTLRAGQTSTIRDDDLTAIRIGPQREKGGDLVADVDASSPTSHRVHLAAGLRNELFDDVGAVSQVLVGYRLLLGRLLLAPRVMIRNALTSGAHAELDLGLGLGLYTRSRRVAASVALDVGALVFAATDPADRPRIERDRIGVQAGAATSIELALGAAWVMSLELRAGLAGFRDVDGVTFEPVVAPALGLSYAFQ